MDKEKEKIVKDKFIELNKKHQCFFNSSIDITFNNLINEVGKDIFNENNGDYEIVGIYLSICKQLRDEITAYVIARFTEENMDEVLKKIDENDKIQFDKYFMEHMKWKEDNKIWLYPIEKRLKEYIENEKNKNG